MVYDKFMYECKNEIHDKNSNDVRPKFLSEVTEWLGFDFSLGWRFLNGSDEKTSASAVLQSGADIFDIVHTGSIEAVRYVVERYGCDILLEQDANGNTLSHWACRLGYQDILAFMIEREIPVDTPNQTSLTSQPIHWACVGGDVRVVDTLLQAGVDVNVTDRSGCTPLIVAAQKGNTHLVGFLLANGAKRNIADNNGDNALHWAAYKGFPEITQLLVYSGFQLQQHDNFGHTPLHLACIAGHFTVVKEMTEKMCIKLDLKDKDGMTPLSLAEKHQHSDIVGYLQHETEKRKKRFPAFDLWHLVFGTSGNSKVPLLIFLLVPLCYGYPLYFGRCIPLTWDEMQPLHIIFWLGNVVMWFSMVVAHSLDPGFLPQETEEYALAVRQMAQLGKWTESHSPITRLCHTCHAVRPLRAKHCRVCNRCVQHFDHHCPFIYNCVGLKNRVWFLIFVTSVTVTCLMVIYFAAVTMWKDEWRIEYQVGLLLAILTAALGGFIAVCVLINAALNLTSNECLNYQRYGYLLNEANKFHNPFNRGLTTNLQEFFHLARVRDIRDVEPTGEILV